MAIFKFRIKQTTNLKPDNISRKESSFWFLKRVEIIQNGTCRWQSWNSDEGIMQPLLLLFNHLYYHKPYTTVQGRHKYTYNKYRIDINIYTVYTTKTWVWDSLENKRFIYISYKFT